MCVFLAIPSVGDDNDDLLYCTFAKEATKLHCQCSDEKRNVCLPIGAESEFVEQIESLFIYQSKEKAPQVPK